MNTFDESANKVNDYFINNLSLTFILIRIFKQLESKKISSLEIGIYNLSKHIYVNLESITDIVDSDKVLDKKRIIQHFENKKKYGFSEFYISDKETYNEIETIEDFNTYDNLSKININSFNILTHNNEPISYKNGDIVFIDIIDSKTYEIKMFDFNFTFQKSIKKELPLLLQNYSFFEACLAIQISYFENLIILNNFLRNKLADYESKSSFNLLLNTIVNQYSPVLISVTQAKQIQNWIDNNSINEKKSNSSGNDKKKDEEDSILSTRLTSSQKAHLFNFLFYFRNNIKTTDGNGTFPTYKEFSENMFVLQGKKYYKGNDYERAISGRAYSKNKNSTQKIKTKEEDKLSIINYLKETDNEYLLEDFNEYSNQHLLS